MHLRHLLFVLALVACRKADPEAKAQPAVTPPAAAAPVPATTDAAPVIDPSALAVRTHLSAATAIVLHAVDPQHAHALGREPTATDFHGFPIRKTVAIPAAEVATVAAAVKIDHVTIGREADGVLAKYVGRTPDSGDSWP